MVSLLKIEWIKMKRQHLWILILLVPLIGASLGAFNYQSSYEVLVQQGDNRWYELWTQVTFFYAFLLLPILSGIFATFICRTEYLDGGWKQLMTFPISKEKVYIAKLIAVLGILFLTQISIVIWCLLAGTVLQIADPLPIEFLINAAITGWIALFPLANLQLWISLRTKSFTIPLIFNILFTFGSIGAKVFKIDAFYPWIQPSYVMASPDENGVESYSVFFITILLMFIITSCLSLWRFYRKDIVT